MGIFDSLLGNASGKSLERVREEFAPLLAPGESVERAFGLIRDLIVCTDRRVVFVNKQGVTGRKVEYLSVPYRSITMFALETAGHFDLEAELRIWVSGQPAPIERSLGRDSGAQDIVALLAGHAPR
ncbi:MAG TPA: PH domain-containing protein [Lysobacter sp.]